MPIYEYQCPKCSLKFELLRPMDKADSGECPSCHQPARRLLSRFASFSKSAEGITNPISGTAPPCSTCSATTCDTCDL